MNRKDELAFLEKRYRKSAFQFIPIYGRRRIGKTRLVQEFIRDKHALYFMADAVSEREQLKNLGRETGDFFHDAILTEAGFKEWYQFFSCLKKKTGEQKMILVIILRSPPISDLSPMTIIRCVKIGVESLF